MKGAIDDKTVLVYASLELAPLTKRLKTLQDQVTEGQRPVALLCGRRVEAAAVMVL